MTLLCPEKALIFRITHIKNIPWILDHGLHCSTSRIQDPRYHAIGNPDIIQKCHQHGVPRPPGGTLSDYIPFYFTPWSPMLLNIKTGYRGMQQTPMLEIIFLVASLHDLAAHGIEFVFTDQHALLAMAHFFSELEDLEKLDWLAWQAHDFKRSEEDPGKMDRYMAEALIYQHLPMTEVKAIACYSTAQVDILKKSVDHRGLSTPVVVESGWYF